MGGEKQKNSSLLDDETTMIDTSPVTGTLLWLGRTARLGAAAAALVALLGLLAYLPGLRVLGSIRPNYIPMAPSSAASSSSSAPPSSASP